MRYARPEFLNGLANETPLPMIVDAECGMPLDLGKWECLWEENGDESSTPCVTYFSISRWHAELDLSQGLNPDPHNLPQLDPRDTALLLDPSSSTGAYATNGISQAGSSSHASTPLGNVTWLRKTEYISREGVQRSGMAEQ